jgi:hypothetical protein
VAEGKLKIPVIKLVEQIEHIAEDMFQRPGRKG